VTAAFAFAAAAATCAANAAAAAAAASAGANCKFGPWVQFSDSRRAQRGWRAEGKLFAHL